MRDHPILLVLILIAGIAGCATRSDEAQKISQEEKSPADVYVRMGVRYMERGNLEVALERLQYALKVDSGYSEAHNAIAVLYERLGLPDKTRYHYEKALNLNPANIGVLNNYGRFLCGKGEYDKADAYFEKTVALPLNNRPWLAMTNAGRCLYLAGKKAEAEKRLREALERNSKFSPALLEMVRISFEQRNYLSARAFLQRYLEVSKHTPETLWIGVQSEKAIGNQELMEKYADYLMENFPQSEEAAKYREASP